VFSTSHQRPEAVDASLTKAIGIATTSVDVLAMKCPCSLQSARLLNIEGIASLPIPHRQPVFALCSYLPLWPCRYAESSTIRGSSAEEIMPVLLVVGWRGWDERGDGVLFLLQGRPG
jgi:hypothetical protein